MAQEQKIIAYKGFNKDLTCRDFQYKEGETYETDRASCCNSGFHACENPRDVLDYYNAATSVMHEVECSGQIDRSNDDSKLACTKIKIGARIDVAKICKAAFEFVKSRCTNKNNANKGKAASAGSYGAASAGENGAAVSRGKSEVGDNGIACARGNGCVVKGGIGSILVVAEENPTNYKITAWKAFRIDGRRYKADTWYSLENGKIVKAE